LPNSITISGFDQFINTCNKLPGELLEDFDEAAGFAAAEWELLAKQAVSNHTDQGGLAGGISHKKNKPGDWEVVSAKEYSAYMEWGTRSKVRVPAELTAYASQFKGKTGETGAKAFIFAWAKRVGLPEDAWWPVFISIMRYGVSPHPFFFVQRPIVEKQFIEDLKQIIETPR
jgi:hypothetical protein